MRHLKWVGGFALLALLLAAPQAASRGAARAMLYWSASIAPALFPFLALMPLLTCSEAAEVYEKLLGRAMRGLFRLPGGAAPAMIVGLLAGTPAGTLAARNIAARAGMNRGQLHRLTIAITGFSPAFMVAGVGAGMLGSAGLGWKLLAAQGSTQLTLALLLRRAWRDRGQPVPEADERPEAQPVRAAVLAVLTIGGYMALFGAIAAAVETRVGGNIADILLCLLDVPSGARRVADLGLAEGETVLLLAAMCGFGGLCVIAQNLSALKGCGLGAAEYIGWRVAAAALNAGYMALLTGLPSGEGQALLDSVRTRPFAAAALAASLLSIPILVAMKKTIS